MEICQQATQWLIMANGLAGEVNLNEFSNALEALNLYLAQKILRGWGRNN